MSMISVEPYAVGFLLTNEDTGETRLVQLDYDFPGVASAFGWTLRAATPAPRPEDYDMDDPTDRLNLRIAQRRAACSHAETDGTIACPSCAATPARFIANAIDFLRAGPDPVEDPGYFDHD